MADRPEPRLSEPGQALLRVLEIGICGTDREIAAGEHGAPPAGTDELVLGHEGLAEVVAVGRAVEGLEPGDLVVPSVRRPCPHGRCHPCRSGRPDFCVTGDYTERGIKGLDGFGAEMVIEEAAHLTRVPAGLSDVAVLTEPLTIAEKALIEVDRIQERLPGSERHVELAPEQERSAAEGRCHRALVLGAGPVGMLGALALVARRYRTFVLSREPRGGRRQALVESLGATYLASAEHPVEALPDVVGGIDLVYEATGAAPLAFRVLERMAPNGVFVLTGIPGHRGPAEANIDDIMRNAVLGNQVVLGTVNAGPDAFQAATRNLALAAAEWPEFSPGLITGRHDPDAAAELLAGRGSGIKDVIVFHTGGAAREA